MPINAEVHTGDPARPAVLVLHGFLQTNEFLSTRVIIDGLASDGLTVLAPNLSLGIPNRSQSLQCEAVHTHTVAQDLAEIDRWVAWLLERGHPSVILIGHSWGSQHALAYAEHARGRPIAGIIAVSLTRAGGSPAQHARDLARARKFVAKHDSALDAYQLSFCKRYTSTASSYLSYAAWDDATVIDTLAALHARGLRVTAIMGSKDMRSDRRWLADLHAAGTEVQEVQGADHFFSSLHEFELVERIEKILKRIEAKS